MTTTCPNCQTYTAIVDGWMHNFEADGFTASSTRHSCGESDRAVY